MRDRGFCNQCGTVYAPGDVVCARCSARLFDDVVTHDTIGRAEVAWLATMAILVVFAVAYVALMGHPGCQPRDCSRPVMLEPRPGGAQIGGSTRGGTVGRAHEPDLHGP